MSSTTEFLAALGINPKEIEAYMLLLQSGTAQASTLARRMKIPTSTAQYACQQLTKKGLLKMVQKGNRYLFSAEPPSKLKVLMEQEIQRLEQRKGSLDSVVSELESMVNPESVLPKVKFFEGRDGIAEAYAELLRDMKDGGEVLSYLHNLEHERDLWSMESIFVKFRDQRIKKKVTRRTISPYSEVTAAHRKDDPTYLRETRFVDKGYFGDVATEVIFSGDKIYSMSYGKDVIFATIVENKPIATLHKAAFELSWSDAKHQDERLRKKYGFL